METEMDDRPGSGDGPPMTQEERTSKVGDLGRGSHEQTQGGSTKPAEDLPGDEAPPPGG